MRATFLIICVLATEILSLPRQARKEEYLLARECSAQCRLPDCRCSSTNIPGDLNHEDVPQFVLFTFDDAVTDQNFQYYQEAFFGKFNPDGCPVGSTYYVSHEWTDYSKVHQLHAHGQEIALHSVTHQPPTSYWLELDEDGMKHEFIDGREMLAHFADIPIEELVGMRLPFLQMGGNVSFQVLHEEGLLYDCSWTTLNYLRPGMWPYTLDYKSTQDCPIRPCPDASITGAWVIPMISWKDQQNTICSFVDSCVNIPTEEEGLLDFFIHNFHVEYEGNRAPFGFYLHASWFQMNPNYFKAYVRFVDYLLTLKDVYIVNSKRVIDWIKNPQSIKNGPLTAACQKTYEPTCAPLTCRVLKGEEERYMTQCVSKCPDVYPWLGNPFGEKQ